MTELKFDNRTTPTEASFKFHVERTGDAAVDTAALTLDISKTTAQKKAEADALADSVKVKVEALSVTAAEVSTANGSHKDAVQTKIEADSSGVGSVLGRNDTLEVKTATVNADDATKIDITYTVTPEDGVESDPVSAQVGLTS